ncbi:MAG: hypothetical protein HC802_18870 [Caldilineaceae bacterium]|nr:hypothetical protein [Caldilineaceae bacterium]
MSFLKRITDLFRGGPTTSSNRYLDLYVLNRRCNEPLTGQVDLLNELSVAEEEEDASYYARKVLHTSGAKRCFSQCEVMVWFDNSKRVLRTEVEGGRLLDEAEYATELARFNAPPDEDVDAPETGSDSSEGSATHASDEENTETNQT